jgi:hypothetical protein
MEADVEGRCGAAHRERSRYRNGYRERRWHIRAGSILLEIPKLRQGCYCLGFLEPRRDHDGGRPGRGGCGDVTLRRDIIDGADHTRAVWD